MSSLVELIAAKQKQVINENFNLTNTNNQVLGNLRGFPYGLDNELPIEVNTSASWEYIENRDCSYLYKLYKFISAKHLLYFINELIKITDELHHHPEIMLKGLIAEVKLYTDDINDVTEIDKELSTKLDEIFEEIKAVY